MFFSIAQNQCSWLAALALVLGTICAVFGKTEIAIALISIGSTLATFKQKDAK